jgi:hypothetical protein
MPGFANTVRGCHPAGRGPNWKFAPINRRLQIRHRGHGASDYTDVGIEREP